MKVSVIRFSSVFLTLVFITFGSCRQAKEPEIKAQVLPNQEVFRAKHPGFAQKLEGKVRHIFMSDSLAGDFLLAVVDEDGLAYSYALNRRILLGEDSGLNNDSPIYVASHTKSFTGTMLKMLDEESVLDLDGSLHHYLPELNLRDSIDTRNITVRQLLNHTHGLMSTQLTWKTAFLGYSGNNSELIKDMNADFQNDPSHRFRYSNVGPILAAMIAEKVTGRSWKEEMERRIFKPLDMEHTSASVSNFDRESIRPSVSVAKNGKVVESGFYKQDITMHASGGILSSVNDLSKWLKANITEDRHLLTRDGWKALHTSSTPQERTYFTYHRTGYSLGWDIARYRGQTILTRFGGLAGIMFHISFMPARKVGVIAFTGDSRTPALSHLMADYAYNLLGAPDSAEAVYRREKKIYDRSFERNAKAPLPQTDNELLQVNDAHDRFAGIYHNSSDWPDIVIEPGDSSYIFQWGVLDGQIYTVPGQNRAFIAALGVLNRGFRIRKDSLFTGSLVYIKE